MTEAPYRIEVRYGGECEVVLHNVQRGRDGTLCDLGELEVVLARPSVLVGFENARWAERFATCACEIGDTLYKKMIAKTSLTTSVIITLITG